MNHRLINGDCFEAVSELGQFDMVFADPPDNIRLGYNEFKDKVSNDEYQAFLDDCVTFFTASAPIVWLSVNSRWSDVMGYLIYEFRRRRKDWTYQHCEQVFTFGQHCKTKLGNNHRPLWLLHHKDAQFYPDQIRVPSWRQRNGDKRANPKGRVPGDVFDMQYPVTVDVPTKIIQLYGDEEVERILAPGEVYAGDVFDFPRVTGNSKQRCDWHPTQLHEELVERCVKYSTAEGGTVLDPFGGTGTTLRACLKTGRICTLVELDAFYCQQILKEHKELRMVA